MSAVRLAAPRALLWLLFLDLCAEARAERLGAAAQGALQLPGWPLGRGRRRGLLAGFLLGTRIPRAHATVEETFEGPQLDGFRSLDLNGDKLLTRQEYEALLVSTADEAQKLTQATMFFEADVDGDELLSLPEFVFSRYLVAESANRKAMEMIAPRLPKDFVQGIDDMFLDLRMGQVTYKVVQRALWKLIGVAEPGPQEVKNRLRDMFEAADILPDGVLNANELDFLHFMVREELISMILRSENSEDEEMQVAGLMEMCDVNGDGRVDLEEAMEAFSEYFGAGSLVVEEKPFREKVTNAFRRADKDGDGGIDGTEVPGFFKALQAGR